MKNRRLLLFFGILAILVLAILQGVPILVNWYLNTHADRIISDMITRTHDFGGHQVRFGKIKLDYDYRGTYLELDSVSIFPQEDIADNKVKINLEAERVSLSGFLWRSFLFDNSIKVDSAMLQNVTISSISPSLDSLEPRKEQPDRKNGKDYKMIQVDKINVDRLTFANKDVETDSTRLSIHDLSVAASNFKLSKEDLNNPESLFDVGRISGYMSNASIHFNDYINVIHAHDLRFNTQEKNMHVEQVHFHNKWGKYQYTGHFPKEIDWIEVDGGSLQLVGMDYKAFFREGILESEKMVANDIDIQVFRDKRKPDDTTKKPLMIQEILANIPQPLHLDIIQIENTRISYEEQPDNDYPQPGNIYFDIKKAEIVNITNIPEMLRMHNELTLKAQAQIMGDGNVDLEIKYFLQDEHGRFTMKGNVSNMELAKLNEMIRPGTGVEIRKGYLDRLDFDIVANDLEGTGGIVMRYHGLEMDIRGEQYGKEQNILQRIGSFLANKLVIRSNNPNKKEELRKGEVYFKRDQSKFIFNYWWKLLLSGMRSTLTGKDEAALREEANNE